MTAILSWLSSGVLSGILAPLVGYFTNKDTLNEKGFEIGAQTDAQVQVAYIQAQVQLAQAQASVNTWWGARAIILGITCLMMVHLGAVVFDSIPFFGFHLPFYGWVGMQDHVVGSWRIAALPGDMAQWEGKIIMSFFLLTPAAPVFNAVASWLHRK